MAALVAWLLAWNDLNARDFGVWLWLERASWLIAVAGIPLLVYQFKSIADALTKRPDIDFGLVIAGAAESERPRREIAVSPTWQPGAEWSDLLTVEFRAVNSGERTARDLVFNLGLPASEDEQLISLDKVHVAADGSLTYLEPAAYLHPDGVQILQLPLRAPRGATEIHVTALVSMADAHDQPFKLRIRFSS